MRLTMDGQEAPETCAAASDIGSEDEEVAADQNEEEPSKRRKLAGLTQFEDEFAVSKCREALCVKANQGDFKGLRAVTPAKATTANVLCVGGLLLA